jgi:Subtilisin inhibitor-like
LKWHAASLVLAIAVLAGCGGDDGDGMPAQPATDLEITVWPNGRSGNKEKATLQCSPPGGTLSDPKDACNRLQDMKRPFVRPSGDIVCTEIYGGPAVAEIRGTFRGAQVNATFARSDGCEIALWDRHQFLFPAQPSAP